MFCCTSRGSSSRSAGSRRLRCRRRGARLPPDDRLDRRRHHNQLWLSIEHRAAPSTSALALDLHAEHDTVALRILEHPPLPETAPPSPSVRVLDALAPASLPMSRRALRDACACAPPPSARPSQRASSTVKSSRTPLAFVSPERTPPRFPTRVSPPSPQQSANRNIKKRDHNALNLRAYAQCYWPRNHPAVERLASAAPPISLPRSVPNVSGVGWKPWLADDLPVVCKDQPRPVQSLKEISSFPCQDPESAFLTWFDLGNL